MTNGPIFLNRDQAPGGTPDATITTGGPDLSSGATSLTFTSVPSWWPGTGIMRGVLWKTGDSDWEYVDVDLSTRSTSTFSLARQTEDAALHPASAHTDGAGFWVLATAAMLQAPAGVGYEDLATGDLALGSANTYADVPGCSHQLAPGVWDIRAMALFDYAGIGSTGNIDMKITDGTNDYAGADGVLEPSYIGTLMAVRRITLTAATTIKLQARAQQTTAHVRQYLVVPGGSIPATLLQCFPVSGSPAITEYVYIREEQAQNTAGGTSTASSWLPRVLNTKVKDTGGIATLASNQFTLPAGDYRVEASAPFWHAVRHRLRLQNITDSTTLILGKSNYSSDTNEDGAISHLHGEFTLTAPKTLELQYQVDTAGTTSGLGVASNFATEVYAEIEIWRGAAVTGGPFGGAGSGQWVKLASLQPTGTNADFTNIPQGYKNLKIIWQAQGGGGAVAMTAQVNGDTGANYIVGSSFVRYDGAFIGNVESGGQTAFNVGGLGPLSDTYPNSGEITVPNYSGAVLRKTINAFGSHFDGTRLYRFNGDGWWNNTAAINRITISPAGGVSFVAGSTFDLYGMA